MAKYKFEVTIEFDDEELHPEDVQEYIFDAVASWRGQYPPEDDRFWVARENDPKVSKGKRVRR